MKEYFCSLKDCSLIDSMNVLFADTAIQKLDEVEEKIRHTNADRFSDIVSEFQSVERFQTNAHKLVHSEDILLYCVTKRSIGLCNSGIRFFTKYDMCEICEEIVWKYAHRGEKLTSFIVLSKKDFLDSQDRDNPFENVLLKKRI